MTAEIEGPEHAGSVLQPVAAAYRNVIRARLLIAWAGIAGGAVAADRLLLAETPLAGLLLVLVPLLALVSGVVAPQRIWVRLAYALEPAMLRIVRGWMFHTDTLVPLVRVQHLDIARGPLDKLFGTASLVVHTAGTHNSVVTLPGLEPERASELAAIIRSHVRADLG